MSLSQCPRLLGSDSALPALGGQNPLKRAC
jgi:hypothetical protein